MSTALMTLPATTDVAEWSPEEKVLVEAAGLVFVHQYGENKGKKVPAPRPVIAKFLHTCSRTGLDPLARQIYCIGRFGSDGLEWSIQTAIDGFRVIAERSKQYAGQDEPEWLTAEHGWVPAFVKSLHGDHPLAARVKVYRHDWDRPMVGIATWDEYAQTKRNGQLTSMWEQRGAGQLAKCAEALALRKAFPQDLSGIYTDDEMDSQTVDVGDEPQAPRRPRGMQTLASRARAAEAQNAPQEASEEPTVPDAPADGVSASDGATGPGADESELFPCPECGEFAATAENSLCAPCEDAIVAQIATEGTEES